MSYVKAKSWHVQRTFTRSGAILARCGLRLPGTAPVSDQLPLTDKSCETCVRLVLHDQDKAAR